MLKKFLFGLPFTLAGLVSNAQTILENKTVNAVPATHLDFDGINDYVNREIKGWEIETKIERSVYNRRKRKLFPYIEKLRIKMAEKFNEFENYFVIDSMPLEVCKMARSSRSKICKEVDYAIPNKGFCASQNLHFYGYKLHAICTINGVFQSFDLSPASVHDIHYLQDIKTQLSDCVILGDKGYLSQTIQLDLFNEVNIEL